MAAKGLAVLRRVARRPFPWSAPTVPRGVELPRDGQALGADYDTAWARNFPARLARALLLETVLRPSVALLAEPDRRGNDRLSSLRVSGGPVIFVANHHSHLDAPLLLTSIPEPWRHKIFTGAAADYFFTNRMKAVASALVMSAIPIDRSRVSRRSADHAAELIDAGWSMLIFPEGGRSPDGWGQPFRGGAAYLSIRCGVPVVPVHLEGTWRILPKGSTKPRRSQVRVDFGVPLRPEPGEDSRKLATRIERAVAALADEAATDWWQARRRAADATTPALTGPDAAGWRRAWALQRKRREAGDRARRSWPRF